MNVYQKSKFACLMDTFDVTGRELADFLHVDYSLISKWRNNKRKLNNRNGYLDKIVDYFIALDAPKDYKKINLLLNTTTSSKNLDKVLKHWLLDTEIQGQDMGIEPFSPRTNGVKYKASTSVYEGHKGRRNAVLNFLDGVLEIPGTPELLLVSQEDMTWLIEDPAFLLSWREKLEKILRQGNKITIIHTVDRKSSSLVHILEHWLPLHLTGRITPLYYPNYTDITYKTTLFILKDHLAVTGLFIDRFSKKMYTTLFSDPISVMQSEWIFEEFLSNSRHLYTPYRFQDFFQLSHEILEASAKEENSYLRMDLPLIHLMPKEDFRSLLQEENFSLDAMEKLLSYHENLQKSSLETLSLYFQRHIYSLDLFERIIREDRVHYYELDMVKGKTLKIPLKYFCKQLEAIIRRLDQYPNYQIALTNRPLHKLDNVNVWVKENVITFAYPSSKSLDSSFYVSSKEPTVVNAFFKYYEHLWNSLPRINKDKEWIKTKLQGLIQKAKNKN